KALLRTGGRYRAQVDTPQILPHGAGQASVRLLVQAGPRMQLRYLGNRALSDAELSQIVSYDGEELLDRALIQEIADRVEHAYHLLGYPDARVLPREIQ